MTLRLTTRNMCLKRPRTAIVLAVTLLLGLLPTSCGLGAASSASPMPSPSPSGALVPPDDGRELTARESYPGAQREAMAWQEDALLYAIVPSYTMARNLGADVGDRPGWVFKFGRPGARMELFVHVVEGEVRSIVQAHPVYFEQPPESLPIDMQSINLDSPQVLQAFALEGYPGYLGQHQEPKLDYELVHLTGTRNPIWTLWDDTTGLALLHVDAVTGQETDDPRGGT